MTIGSTYALIAIGYTMVYGIIGMINFAHGEVYMIGSYVAFIALAGLAMMGIHSLPLLMTAAFVATIVVTSAYGYSIERVAYRPCAAATADPADFRHRHVDLPAEHRIAVAGLQGQVHPQPDPGELLLRARRRTRSADFVHADPGLRGHPGGHARPDPVHLPLAWAAPAAPAPKTSRWPTCWASTPTTSSP
jgi:hypothetical protein